MNLNEYAKQALRTKKDYPVRMEMEGDDLSILDYTLGLVGETAEFSFELCAAGENDNSPYYGEEIIDEAGDVLWYIIALADELDDKLAQYLLLRVKSTDCMKDDSELNRRVGYFAETVKHLVFHKENREELILELELQLEMTFRFYIRTLNSRGITLEEVAQKNAEKLMKRYPDGYNDEDSANRHSK